MIFFLLRRLDRNFRFLFLRRPDSAVFFSLVQNHSADKERNAAGTGTTGVFAVNVSGLTPNTVYSYAAYATNSMGFSYSATGSFTTLATPQSWQQTWFGGPTNNGAAYNADPYHTGVQNYAVLRLSGRIRIPAWPALPSSRNRRSAAAAFSTAVLNPPA